MTHLDILFDNTEFNSPGQFVAVEDDKGCSVDIGEWIWRDDLGFWAYRIESETPQEPPSPSLPDERWAQLTENIDVG